jgi:hypothetical protein
MSGIHPVWGLGAGQFNAATAANIPGFATRLNGRYRTWLWAAATTGAAITIPSGYTSVINVGTAGANTGNICIARKTQSLALDGIGGNITPPDGALSPNAVSLCGNYQFYPDPR